MCNKTLRISSGIYEMEGEAIHVGSRLANERIPI